MAVLDSIREVLIGNGNGDRIPKGVQEQLNTASIMNEILQENIQRLEMQLEDEGWRPISGELEQEFTRHGLDLLTDLARAMYIANPLINRAVNVTGYYVWAQGVTVQASDQRIQDLVIDPMHEDYTNQDEFFGTQASLLTEVDQMVDGNVFLGLPTNVMTGEVYVRSIPSNEIREIISKPGDRAVVMFYRRSWVERKLDTTTGAVVNEQREALYPDWRYFPTSRPEQMGSIPVMWDSPIVHRRTGGLKQMRFGVPEVYAAIPWARAYKGFLEDWHTLVKSLSRFAWQAVAKGRGKAERTKKKVESPSVEELEEGAERGRRTSEPTDGSRVDEHSRHHPQRGRGCRKLRNKQNAGPSNGAIHANAPVACCGAAQVCLPVRGHGGNSLWGHPGHRERPRWLP
jgi:hypothetical protein